MKIVKCECPSCGAKINSESVKTNGDFFNCDHCGSLLYVEGVIKQTEKEYKVDIDKPIMMMLFFEELIAKCKEYLKELKENNIEVSKTSDDYDDDGYFKPSFFYSDSLKMDTCYFPYTFNGITIPYNTFKRLSLFPEIHDTMPLDENSIDDILEDSSFDAKQKETIKMYLQHLVMLMDYNHYLDRYILLVQQLKEFEQNLHFSNHSFSEFGGYLTVSTVTEKRYEYEKKLVEIQKAVHDYEFSKNKEKSIANGDILQVESPIKYDDDDQINRRIKL